MATSRWRHLASPARRDERIRVWVRRPDKGADCEDEIAAIGTRVQRRVTLHGISINVASGRAHFKGIVPLR